MAHRAMRLKPLVREISERRQVGDLEDMMAGKGNGAGGGSAGGQQPAWWRNVGMDEGL